MLSAAEERDSAGRAVWRPQMAYIVVSPAWRGEHDCVVQLCKGILARACLSMSTSQGSLEQPIGVGGPLSGASRRRHPGQPVGTAQSIPTRAA